MGKAVMSIFKNDVMEAAGPSQLCTGYPACFEVFLYYVLKIFNKELDGEGVTSRCHQRL